MRPSFYMKPCYVAYWSKKNGTFLINIYQPLWGSKLWRKIIEDLVAEQKKYLWCLRIQREYLYEVILFNEKKNRVNPCWQYNRSSVEVKLCRSEALSTCMWYLYSGVQMYQKMERCLSKAVCKTTEQLWTCYSMRLWLESE